MLRERGGVDQDERQAGTADLLDLGVAVREADGDDAVDGRTAHRAEQAAVERRDEVQAVAALLRGEGDAFTERPEGRVAEADAERLRGQHADHERLALGEHPGDRMRRVSQVLGDLEDPRGGLGREPFRRVEGKGDSRLAHSRFVGHVCDPRTLGPLIDEVVDSPLVHRVSTSGPPIECVEGPWLDDSDGPRLLQNRFSKPV